MSKEALYQSAPWKNFTGPNLGYVIEVYEEYLEDPEKVDPELRELFDEWGAPTPGVDVMTTKGQADISFQLPANPDEYSKIVAAVKLADNIRTYGHLAAETNPLFEKEQIRRLELSESNLT